MTDAEESLVGFVTAQYNKLKNQANDTSTPSKEDIKAVIVRIDKLLETFKNPDSKHDAIVAQLKEFRNGYDVNLNPTEYPHHKNALAGLNAIVDELKEEEDSGAKEGEE